MYMQTPILSLTAEHFIDYNHYPPNHIFVFHPFIKAFIHKRNYAALHMYINAQFTQNYKGKYDIVCLFPGKHTHTLRHTIWSAIALLRPAHFHVKQHVHVWAGYKSQ